jgi:hypothetical protein
MASQSDEEKDRYFKGIMNSTPSELFSEKKMSEEEFGVLIALHFKDPKGNGIYPESVNLEVFSRVVDPKREKHSMILVGKDHAAVLKRLFLKIGFTEVLVPENYPKVGEYRTPLENIPANITQNYFLIEVSLRDYMKQRIQKIREFYR